MVSTCFIWAGTNNEGESSMNRTTATATFGVACIAGQLCFPMAEASAQPPGFPDLNAFTPVDPAPYTASARGGGDTFFKTPDGIQCALPNPYPWKPGEHLSAGCSGPLPGLPAGAPASPDGCTEISTPTGMPTDLGPYSFQKGGSCPILTSQSLVPGQKITAGAITCAVGANRLTACIDPALNRGFVLQPSGSWTF